jgi:hypothetical protein
MSAVCRTPHSGTRNAVNELRLRRIHVEDTIVLRKYKCAVAHTGSRRLCMANSTRKALFDLAGPHTGPGRNFCTLQV